MTSKKSIIHFPILLSLIAILGCVPATQKESHLETQVVFMSEPAVDTPSALPSLTPTQVPTPTLSYSYMPIISDLNAKDITRFDRFDGDVSSLAFSPNGKYLAATFDNGAGIIWDISTVKYWDKWQDAPKKVFLAEGNLSFDSSNGVLATGGTLIDLSTMDVIQKLHGTVVFSPTGNTLALYNSTDISLWNYDGNHWTPNYKIDKRNIVNVAFSQDGSLLGEALHWGGGEGVEIRKVADHNLLYSFPPPDHGHPAHFNFYAYAFLAFSPDNQFVATGTRDQPVIRLWNLKTGELIKDIGTDILVDEEKDPASGEIISSYEIPQVKCIAITQDSKVIILTGYLSSIVFKTLPD